MKFLGMNRKDVSVPTAGLAGWLLGRLRGSARPRPRLALVERIGLGQRQTLSLVEADGCRFLIATSADGSPAFCALNGPGLIADARSASRSGLRRRVSW